jgi:Txe/YoeB family toxin of Txe-Axe toxin-antitoxin module
MSTFVNEILPKKPSEYICELCDFKTCNKKDYNRHIDTKKHKKGICQSFSIKNTQNYPKLPNRIFQCACGKKYKDKSGLWRHSKKCTIQVHTDDSEEDENIVIYNEESNKDQLILMLIKQNAELVKETSEFKNMMMEQQNMMMKVIENGTHNTTNNTTHTNSHNKAFNLQFFLNETCKDAMNITDFVESIQLQLSDLEKVGEIGYVEGISNIIVKNLNALDVTQRPVHCTDKKRETIYIKDEDKWEKDEEKNKIRKVIKKVSTKNARLIQKFKEKHPDYNEYHSKYSTQYHKLIIESFGGSGDNDLEKEDKIIRNITKNVVVDK